VSQPCAYCDRIRPLTRDHVWPECFLDRVGRLAAHFSHQAGRAHGADYVVSDVCSECNNARLSELDSYFCTLYDEYFAITHGAARTVEFRFDYDLLARALLKIAYNSARSAGSADEPVRALRKYVLGEAARPYQLAVFVELVSPSLVLDPASGEERELRPDGLYRSAITRLLTAHGDRLHSRIVAVGSFYFHILVPSRELPDRNFDEAVMEFSASIDGSVRLHPGNASVILNSSPQNALSSLMPHIKEHFVTYKEFFERRKGN
jgi:hypothetical protein